MALEILYFAWVRDGIGKDGERIDSPSPDTTVEMLVTNLAERGGGYAQVLADRTRLRAALDQKFVPLDTPIGGARELALFPPVTGG
ncbi:molybdopterin synthase sulfur carrier subunit [Sphingobium sp. SCG-1]|uniref:MoaD/ThiS family protein n=1 Tax=Sphingobium sp. SCG-1 TaxID=2072936 RepID=UPI000CD6BAD2|nr:MoaD/ThiS family protein [Sphingobium sp. SCG-1]AUW57399.1 molybdopterin synthase sulfur carrier subunit [Sphingobium sp. SCG-1]